MKSMLHQQASSYDNKIEKLDSLFQALKEESNSVIGYPIGKDFDYSPLYPFLGLPLNNLGDPFRSCNYRVNSHALEVKVVDFFADLFRATSNSYWGYMTNGGTEGNLFGLYSARKFYPNGITYYSRSAHYSIQKNIDILSMECREIRVNEDDSMDLNDLQDKLDPSRPVIVIANIGSTMKEARDDIKTIRSMLTEQGVRKIYIHSDAALCGAIFPFLEPRPHFDFADGCDSITVSGHKFIGCPMPCGVTLIRKDRIAKGKTYVQYVDSYDNTISGSRNGITPLFLWYQLTTLGKNGIKKRVESCLNNAQYAEEQLRSTGIKVFRNSSAITVVFERPSDALVKKWQLASENEWSHLLCMPCIGRTHIDAFVHDLIASRNK